MQMCLNLSQTLGQIFLHQARFRQHRESGVEFFAAHEIEFTRDGFHAIFCLCFPFMAHVGDVIDEAAAESEQVVDKRLVRGHERRLEAGG